MIISPLRAAYGRSKATKSSQEIFVVVPESFEARPLEPALLKLLVDELGLLFA